MARELHDINVITKGNTNKKIIPLKCPGCGAGLGATEHEELMECPYCNTKAIVPKFKKKELEEETIEETQKEEIIESKNEPLPVSEEKPEQIEESINTMAIGVPSELKQEEKIDKQDHHETHTIIGVDKGSKESSRSKLFGKIASIAYLSIGVGLTVAGAQMNAVQTTESAFITQGIGAFTALMGGMFAADAFFGAHILNEKEEESPVLIEESDNSINATMLAMNNGAQIITNNSQSEEENVTEAFHRQL